MTKRGKRVVLGTIGFVAFVVGTSANADWETEQDDPRYEHCMEMEVSNHRQACMDLEDEYNSQWGR